MAAHTAVGYLIAVGLGAEAQGGKLGSAALGVGLWVACLNGGTLAINSAFDRDEGDVAYLKRPPPPPRHLFAFGFGLMLAGQMLAFLLPPPYVAAYAACFLLSLLYSVPPVRLKAVAGADWLINMWGFGAITPFAGWATTGLPLPRAETLVLLAFCPLFAALYPLTQLYQADEDRRRGDRTLALRLGMAGSLDVAIGAVLVAFALFGFAALLSGWAAEARAWRIAVLATALGAWLAVLIPWRSKAVTLSPAGHQRGMYLALGAWAATDAAVLAAWAT
jgi:4-hydroxybenzoate polyprenyltransferase